MAGDAQRKLSVEILDRHGAALLSASLNHFMFRTPEGNDGTYRSWNGFVTHRDGAPNATSVPDTMARFRRPAAALADQDRPPGLDLISRAGSVRVESLP